MPAPLFTSNPSEFTRLEGLYIFEQNPPAFVRGISLGTVGVFGRTTKGPVDEPVLITSEARFLEVFGGRDYGQGGALINTVWRSLLNKPFGALYVVRAANSGDLPASFNAEDTDGGAGAEIAKIEASSVGLWGNSVKFKVEDATDGDSNHWNLTIRYLGADVTYENLDTTTGNDNLVEVIGDNLANNAVVAKLADGRPLNTAAFTGAFAAALDSDGFMNLGTTVTGFTSVAGTTNALVDADYTGTGRAIDAIKEFKGVSIVYCAEDVEARVTTVNTALVTAAASASDRVFCIWSGDHGDSVSDVITYQGTLNRSDRIIHCFNSPYTLDTEVGALIQTPPVEWMASILSQTDVDIHPGEEATKSFTAGMAKLTLPAATRNDYVLLREAGIAALERDEGFVFVSGITTDLTPGKTEITRRRSADFLQLSAASRLRFFVKKKNLAATRRIMGGEIVAFSQTLKKPRACGPGLRRRPGERQLRSATRSGTGIHLVEGQAHRSHPPPRPKN